VCAYIEKPKFLLSDLLFVLFFKMYILYRILFIVFPGPSQRITPVGRSVHDLSVCP
jgi:hypothetical protein